MSTIIKARGGLTPLEWVNNLSLFPLLAPAIRIEEFLDGDTYTVRAELPGTDPAKDVTVTYADGELRLHVVRSTERKDKAAARGGLASSSRARSRTGPDGVVRRLESHDKHP